jgi:predicted transposase YbfD/YdcC
MECMVPGSPSASAATLPATPTDLLTAFASVPDPRRQASVVYPLAALLALTLTAILANQHSVLAIAEWAARQGATVLTPLGFTPGHTPRQSTLQRLFAKLDAARLAAALAAAFAPAATPDASVRGGQGVAIDGKAQRGRLAFQSGGCPVHSVTAFCQEYGLVLAQEPITPGHGTAKSEAELTVAPTLIARLEWRGRVLTGDALFCQRHLCTQVLDAGGDYLFIVKENQPTLSEDIRLLFDPPFPVPPLNDRREAQSCERGHGREQDTRHLVASTDLNGYCDWPGLAQVFRLERTWQEHGQTKHAVRYGITSLPPTAATADQLLARKRGHWKIENLLHLVKDVTFREDQSLVHLAAGPTILAMLRDTAVSVLRLTGCRAIASRLRALADSPTAALALLTTPLPVRA